MTSQDKLNELNKKYGINNLRKSQAEPSAIVSIEGKGANSTVSRKLDELNQKYGVNIRTAEPVKTPTVNNVKSLAPVGTVNVEWPKMAGNTDLLAQAKALPAPTQSFNASTTGVPDKETYATTIQKGIQNASVLRGYRGADEYADIMDNAELESNKRYISDTDRTALQDMLKMFEISKKNALTGGIEGLSAMGNDSSTDYAKAQEKVWGDRNDIVRQLEDSRGAAACSAMNDERNRKGFRKIAVEEAQSMGTNLPGQAVNVITTLLTGSPMLGNKAGSAWLGLQMAGNAYKEARENGHDSNAAMKYAIEQGIEEAVTDAIVGMAGAAASGTKWGKKAAEKIGTLGKTSAGKWVMKVIAGTAVNGVSEFAQEALQYYTENASKQFLLGEDVTYDFNDAMYAGFMGLVNSFVMGAAHTATNAVATTLNATQYAASATGAGDMATRAAVAREVAANIDTDSSHYKNTDEYAKAQNYKVLLEDAASTLESGNELSAFGAGNQVVNRSRINANNKLELQNPNNVQATVENVTKNIQNPIEDTQNNIQPEMGIQESEITEMGTQDNEITDYSELMPERHQEHSTLKQQIVNNKDILEKMSSVAEVSEDTNGVSWKDDKKSYAKRVLQKVKGIVKRAGFGDIVIDKTQINDSTKYVNGEANVLAYAAIPDVIEKGKVIEVHENHKNNGFQTITFAAPVTIKGITGNMAVVVKRTKNKNRYKVHEILLPDGQEIFFDNVVNTKKEAVSRMEDVGVPTEQPMVSASLETASKMTALGTPSGQSVTVSNTTIDPKTPKVKDFNTVDLQNQMIEEAETAHEKLIREATEDYINGDTELNEEKYKSLTDDDLEEILDKVEELSADKVVKEISLTDEFTTDMAPEATAMNYTTSADVAPEATAKEVRSDFTDIIIPGQEKVKLSGKDNKGSDAKRLDASGLNENQTKLLEAIRANDTVTAEDLMDRMPADEVDEVITYGDKNGSPENDSNTYETSGNNNQAEAEKVMPLAKPSEQSDNSSETEGYLPLQNPDDIIKAEMKRREDMEASRKLNRPEPESKKVEPRTAISDLKKDIQRRFSIPQKGRGEINDRIEEIARKTLKDGKITSTERDQILDMLYSAGSVAVDVETTAKAVREMLQGRKIYVSDQVRQEYGKDWNAFRMKMMGNKVYLTTDKSKSDISLTASELNEYCGRLFDEDNELLALQEMEYYLEEGKPKTMNLYEESKMMEDMYGEGSGQEHLNDLAVGLDGALKDFAYKAGIETDLRERINREVADRIEKQEISARNKQTMRDIKRLRKRMGMNDTRLKEAIETLSPEDRAVAENTIMNVSTSAQRLTKKAMEKMKLTRELYEAKIEEDPNYIPDKPTLDLLQEMDRDYLKGKTLEELSDIHRTITTLMTHLNDMDREIGEKRHEEFEALYRDASSEIKAAKGRKKPKGAVSAGAQKLIQEEQLTPSNYIEMLAGWNPESTFAKTVGKQLEDGERAKKKIIVEMNDIVSDFRERNADWIAKSDGQGKDAEWIELEFPSLIGYDEKHKPITGKNVKVYVTPSMMVELARGARNDDNLRHAEGGLTFPDRELYSSGLRKQAYAQGKTVKIAPENMKMTFRYENLDEQGKELFKIMDRVFDDYSKGKINSTSQTLDGVDRAMNNHYSKIYTNKNYRVSDMTIDESLGGIGSLKSRVTSKNPMLAMSVWDAFDDNMDTVSKYAGMSIPIRNVQSLLNWRQDGDSMKNIIAQKWGDSSVTYLENLIKNMSNKHYDEKSGIEQFGDAVLSNYITATFGFNPGIVLKQFASFPSAAAVLGFDTVPTMKQISSVDPELIKKYTPELAYRSMGWSTAELAELKNNPNWTQKNKVTRFLAGGAIQAMDYFTVKSMWPWAENYVKKNNPEIRAGSERFYDEVAKVYDRAVSETQPMYDEMHRANIMKHPSSMARAFTMFKTVPMQQQNMIRKAYGEWHSAGGAEKKKAGKEFASAVISLVLANVMFEGIEYLNQLWKNKGKNYRDENGELTAGSVGTEMARGVIEDFVGTVIGGDEMVDFVKYVNGDSWKFEIDDPGLTQVNELWTSVGDFVKETRKISDDVRDIRKNDGSVKQYMEENREELFGSVKDLASDMTRYMSGVPINNIEKYLIGTLKWVSPEIAEGYQALWDKTNKSDLKGLGDAELKVRVNDLIDDRFEATEDSKDELVRLYKSTEVDAIPADAPAKITVDGEEIKLTASMKQKYSDSYRKSMNGSLEAMFSSKEYQSMSDGQKADSLRRAYELSRDIAKSEIGAEKESKVQKWEAASESGISLGTYVAITSLMADMDGADAKRKALHDSDISGSQKLSIYRNVNIGADDAQQGVIDRLKTEDPEKVFDIMYELKPEKGRENKISRLAESGLSEKGKKEVYFGLLVGSGATKDETVRKEKRIVSECEGAGIKFDEYLKHKVYFNSVDGDKNVTKQEKVVKYIKTQNESKWEALWELAGYNMSTYESKMIGQKSLELENPNKISNNNKLTGRKFESKNKLDLAKP